MKLLHAILMSIYFFFLTNATMASAVQPFLHPESLRELSEPKVCKDEGQTKKILEKYKGWISRQDSGVIYRWLSTEYELSGRRYSPLVFLGTNAYAVSWFLERAFEATERNSGNERLVELVRNTLHRYIVFADNTTIENLLQNAFSATNSNLLAQVLFNLVNSELEFEPVTLNPQRLIEGALQNRNYHLISDYIFNTDEVKEDPHSFHLITLKFICSDHSLWETTTELEMARDSLFVRDDGESAIQANQESVTSASSFSQFLHWLYEAADTDTLNSALAIAREYENQPAIEWLVHITDNHDFTDIDLTSTEDTSTQRRVSTSGLAYVLNPNYVGPNTTSSELPVNEPAPTYLWWLTPLFCFRSFFPSKK